MDVLTSESCDEQSGADLTETLNKIKELEKLMSESNEYNIMATAVATHEDNKQKNKSAFNGNKMLNELLDKPIVATNGTANQVMDGDSDAGDDEEEDDEEEEEEELEDDEEAEDRSKGEKRSLDEEDENNGEEECVANGKSKAKPKNSGSKKKKCKKSQNPQLRKNIKSILTETELVKETIQARKEEEERHARQQARLREMSSMRLFEIQSQLNASLSNTSMSSSVSADEKVGQSFAEIPDDDVLVLSSDDEDNASQFNYISCPTFNLSGVNGQSGDRSAEIIDLTSGDEDSASNIFRPQFASALNYYNNYARNSLDDEISIINECDQNYISDGSEDKFEDLNNCGSHTNDLLNTPDSEGRVLVNVAHPPEDPDMYLAPQIARSVKPHQIGGIRFMYDNLVESIEHYKNSVGLGCILSHSMGLGKTMQVIAFVDVFLSHTDAKHVLCIVPINTLQNWISEFNMWLPAGEHVGPMDKFVGKKSKKVSEDDADVEDVKHRNFKVFALNEAKSMLARAKEILLWRKNGGVLLLGYEMYRILTSKDRKKSTKDEGIDPQKWRDIHQELHCSLIDPGPDLIVCDEGHRIKNCNAATSLALKDIRTKRRIVLTGYPLQNNLIEYWCMVDFVRPNYLGLKSEFTNMFERPIANGQCSDSTEHDRNLMRYRAHVLHKLLKGFVQRRSHSVLKNALPQKHEFVIFCRLSAIQKQLMLAFLNTAINDPSALGTISGRVNTLLLFSVCCKIWNHPDIIFDIVREGKSPDDLDIDYPTNKSKKSSCNNNNNKKRSKQQQQQQQQQCDDSLIQSQSQPNNSLTPNNSDIYSNIFDAPLRTPKSEQVIDYSWAKQMLSVYRPGDINNSYKMIILFEIIEKTITCGDRLLLYSQSLFTLDLIERYLQTRNVPNSSVQWCKYVNYYRLDGSTSSLDREKYINQFNNKKSAHLFLVSTRAGSLGINLIGANRIVIMDASWNPCHDAQAACRIYRYGQTKTCYIYRLICDNSLEKKIYDRQVNKQGMANRVVDEQNIEAHFTWREIHSLLDDLNDIREPPVEVYGEHQLTQFGDAMIKHICSNLNNCITKKPFEHESLLLDRKETKLSRGEKQLAERLYNMAKLSKDGGNGTSARSQLNSRVLPANYNHGYYNMQSNPMLPSQMTPMPNLYDLPPYSQPLPPTYPSLHNHNFQSAANSYNHFSNLNARDIAMLSKAKSVRRVNTPTELNINISPGKTLHIPKGEEIIIISTENGLFIRTKDGNLISVKGSESFVKMQSQMQPSFIPLSNNDSSFGIIQQNLHCGGTVQQCVPSHARASSTQSHPPEIVQLSDDEEDDNDSQENDMITTHGSNTHFGPQNGSSICMVDTTNSNGSSAITSNDCIALDSATSSPSTQSSYHTAYNQNVNPLIDSLASFDYTDDDLNSIEPTLYQRTNNEPLVSSSTMTSTPLNASKLNLDSLTLDSTSASLAASYSSPLSPSLSPSSSAPIGSSIFEASTLSI